MKKKNKKVNAAILIIGNEILSGRTQDKNIAFISNWLNSKCGISVKEVRIIPDEEKIIAKKVGKIGWMVINNPEKRNAISLSMREAMTQVFNEYDSDPEVRVLIIKGAGGKAFISGACLLYTSPSPRDS